MGRSLWVFVFALAGLTVGSVALAEDGYDLWLRYQPVSELRRAEIQESIGGVLFPKTGSPTLGAAEAELDRGLTGLTGRTPPRHQALQRGTLVLGTPSNQPLIPTLGLPLNRVGEEGYVIRSVDSAGRRITVIAANTDQGLLYGSFALLARMQAGESIGALDIVSAPKVRLRMLNHWDDLDRHVERGYAGASLWDWWKLPDIVDPRYTDYARANASIGINATVLNNVGAAPEILSDFYIAKAKVLADVFRPYGIRVFLSVRFSSPIELGGLKSADPLDPAVQQWWRLAADRVYAAIPDFGGFLVKADSEGQPGPIDYGRNHADGANMLAAALAPHHGIVLWRAFVYSEKDVTDRAMQSYNQLKSLDGKFADNVVLQVKNGPIDFQPREPLHPLFGAMPRTSMGLELQITKEYLGFSTHLAYLGTLYEEVLKADTYAHGKGSLIARIVDGTLDGRPLTVMAGVANTGTDRNWSGSHFDQANWFVFGRLAWNPDASAEQIAIEWAKLTFGTDPKVVQTSVQMMMGSREAVVNYMTPLGLAHLMATGHHYGPGPWISDLARPEWNPVYYHHADASGIGFDRTSSGSNAVAQYAPQLAAVYADPANIPLEYLLWFHHVGWDRKLATGRTTWEELVHRYDQGVLAVADMQAQWATLEGRIDAQRFGEVRNSLAVQRREAQWWRDACIAYFQSRSGRPLPPGVAAPAQSLDYYQGLKYPFAPGN